MVDEGEAHMQACPIIVDTLAHIGLAKKRMAPPTVPNAPAAPNRTHMGNPTTCEVSNNQNYRPRERLPDAHGRGGLAGTPKDGDAVRSSSLGRN